MIHHTRKTQEIETHTPLGDHPGSAESTTSDARVDPSHTRQTTVIAPEVENSSQR
ncbi:uncharacterized protein PgNI_07642 [Pyricularia grisea]|uniref:Uncharacterized protein n=1 Tax=Pyricularia grisea TaxID=148305 RepID=A0A6P8B036_PYRGI|nr:uncharacterized protein PgNI_07642 [Pyricularia grisea]TLD08181.1 hypothetical protein PgNI_07642 [Pyricularia grisea]